MAVRIAALAATRPSVRLHLGVERLAGWLVVAVGLDLLITRFLVRMAIFIPKGEPWATLSAGLGRLGAMTDVLVPLVGVLLLTTMLARAGHAGDAIDGLLASLVAVVAAAGFALLVFAPPASLLAALDGLVVAVSVVAAVRVLVRPHSPRLARAGLGALAASVILAALARIVLLPALSAAGEVAFVGGTALMGLAGFRQVPVTRRAGRRWLAAGGLVALVVLLADGRSPVMWGSLSIWSLGLTGVVPAAAVATALGLATAGLPRLGPGDRAPAQGAAIVVLAGFGLAASGLLLAALLGLLLASSRSTSPAPARA